MTIDVAAPQEDSIMSYFYRSLLDKPQLDGLIVGSDGKKVASGFFQSPQQSKVWAKIGTELVSPIALCFTPVLEKVL